MFGFTNNWFQRIWRYTFKGVKKIRLAVVGTRSSGKSYQLYDMIKSLDGLGFSQENLPIDFPYASFGQYFYNTMKNGQMNGTPVYPLRQENHYCAMLKNEECKGVDFEFVNIPGEIFLEGKSLAQYGVIRNALLKTKSLFKVTLWENIGGEELLIVEPNTKDYNRPKDEDLKENLLRDKKFDEWVNVFFRLKMGEFVQKKVIKKSASGSYLLKHMQEMDIDSFMCSIASAWSHLHIHNVDLTEFTVELNMHFCFFEFCLDATDFVVCDKLVQTEKEKYDTRFASIMTNLQDKFLSEREKKHLYFSFRCADVLIRQDMFRSTVLNKLTAKTDVQKRNAVYAYFLDLLNKDFDPAYIDNKFRKGNYEQWIGCPGLKLDENEGKANAILKMETQLLTGLTIDAYCDNIFGGLVKPRNKGAVVYKALANSYEGFDGYIESITLPVLPHVYFTATPIDQNFTIYENSKDDQTEFVLQDSNTGQYRTFSEATSFCFGTLQLCQDILLQHEVGLSVSSQLLQQHMYK